MRPRQFLATAAALTLPLTLIATETGPTYTEETETLYISAGCPSDATGQCTSTRWLGKQTGDATSNFTYAITPVDEVFYRADGTIRWRDYPSDLTFAEDGYLLDDTRDLGVTLTLSSQGAGANVTVHARAKLNLTMADGTTENRTITAPDQSVLLMTAAEDTQVQFALDLPDDLAGATLNRMTVEVALHGANAMAGFINQQGGSPVTIPHLVEVPEPPAPTS